MSLDQEQQEIAETLYHAWKAEKDNYCAKRRMTRVADALDGLAKAIRSELAEGIARCLPAPAER